MGFNINRAGDIEEMGYQVGDFVVVDGYSMKDRGCEGKIVAVDDDRSKVKLKENGQEHWYCNSLLRKE